ncbi:MAG: hypothetical protein HeimC3_26890 [Candidatus Heimdallarchaeota archaeon LC_3]|nr:MAG: hypothetical protein HeimC3_26890 [Candidatus Heimdallarchaeota archaeon LC_3]
MIVLEPWEAILLSIIRGSFIGGIIFFLFSFFVNLSHIGDQGHDTSIDHDVGLDVDVDGDIDVGIDIDTDVDISIDIDHDIDVSTDIDHDIDHSIDHDSEIQSFTDTSPAPFLLLLSSFLLSFGALGEILYNLALDPILRLLIVVSLPFLLTKGVSRLWKKVAVDSSYEIPSVKIDNQVITLTTVDHNGGLVIADSSDINRPGEKLHLLGRIKMQAKTIPGNEPIPKGSIGYVVDIDKKQTLIIDLWPTPPQKNKTTHD